MERSTKLRFHWYEAHGIGRRDEDQVPSTGLRDEEENEGSSPFRRMRQEQGLRGFTRNRQALPRPPRQGGAGSWLSPHCGRERRGLRVCGGSLLLDRGAKAIRESSRQGGVVTGRRTSSLSGPA